MKGLKSQIADLEKHIALKKKMGKDTREEEGWLKNWKRELRRHPEEA